MYHHLLAALLVPLALAGPALAHDVGVECKVRGARVEVEAYFDDDTPLAGARVSVAAAEGEVVASGKTDAKGVWSFPRPAPGTYQVLVDAGGGHRAKQRMVVPESGDSDPQPPAASRSSEDVVPTTISTGPPREEFTRFPWARVSAGIVVIAMLGGLGWLVMQWRKAGQ